MHKPRTNSNVLEINQSIIELLAEWRISEKDDELIFTKIVGLQLKKIRLMRGYTQTRVSKAINVTFQQIQKYEKGENRIPLVRLFEIGQYLKKPISYFLQDTQFADKPTEADIFNKAFEEAIDNIEGKL